jgi:hypothetical protein
LGKPQRRERDAHLAAFALLFVQLGKNLFRALRVALLHEQLQEV